MKAFKAIGKAVGKLSSIGRKVQSMKDKKDIESESKKISDFVRNTTFKTTQELDDDDEHDTVAPDESKPIANALPAYRTPNGQAIKAS